MPTAALPPGFPKQWIVGSGAIQLDRVFTPDSFEVAFIYVAAGLVSQTLYPNPPALAPPPDLAEYPMKSRTNAPQESDGYVYNTNFCKISAEEFLVVMQSILAASKRRSSIYPSIIASISVEAGPTDEFKHFIRVLTKHSHIRAFELATGLSPPSIQNALNFSDNNLQDIVKVAKDITDKPVWLKIPWERAFNSSTIMSIKEPDALTLGYGRLAFSPNYVPYHPKYPSNYVSPTHFSNNLYNFKRLIKLARVPVIYSGGIFKGGQVAHMLEEGAALVQVTSTLYRNWWSWRTLNYNYIKHMNHLGIGTGNEYDGVSHLQPHRRDPARKKPQEKEG